MSFAYGPFTDTLGFKLTTTSNGAGGLILSCPKYASSITVTAANLAVPIVAEYVRRLEACEDFVTNWRNLSIQLGLGDPGVGTPAT